MRNAGLVVALLQLLQAASASGGGMWGKAKAALECNLCKTSQLTGTVEDCCVDFETVDEATSAFYLPLLEELQQRKFFTYFKVNLEKDCPFWTTNNQCHLRDCSICECTPEEIPPAWLEEESVSNSMADVTEGDDCDVQIRKEQACEENTALEMSMGRVDYNCSDPIEANFNPWQEMTLGGPKAWTEVDDRDEDMIYVNLLRNPERFTGYSGASAQKVWMSIYLENCFGGFAGATDQCREKRVFFRLMSGLQSSITTHIAKEYFFADSDLSENGYWGPNLDLFVNGVGAHPDRMTNLYFAYLFMMRALAKAAPLLEAHSFNTGNPEDDALTKALVKKLLGASLEGPDSYMTVTAADAVPMCVRGFDESDMFNVGPGLSGVELSSEVHEKMQLKEDFVSRFHNVSRIMDCVSCEKCKVWGKLQTLGISTAVKIMLASQDGEDLKLTRNEIIALMNTAAQLAKSVGSIREWRWMEVTKSMRVPAALIALAIALGLTLCYYFWPARSGKKKRKKRGGSAQTKSKGKEKGKGRSWLFLFLFFSLISLASGLSNSRGKKSQ
ncbi:unnamed protein product [Chrysoparadoxa australica]